MLKNKGAKYKYEIFLTDRYNIVHKIQPGSGYKNVFKCVTKGFKDLAVAIKIPHTQGRLVVKDIEREAIVLNTGLMDFIDHSQY